MWQINEVLDALIITNAVSNNKPVKVKVIDIFLLGS